MKFSDSFVHRLTEIKIFFLTFYKIEFIYNLNYIQKIVTLTAFNFFIIFIVYDYDIKQIS